jgi:hypothetical protein
MTSEAFARMKINTLLVAHGKRASGRRSPHEIALPSRWLSLVPALAGCSLRIER